MKSHSRAKWWMLAVCLAALPSGCGGGGTPAGPTVLYSNDFSDPTSLSSWTSHVVQGEEPSIDTSSGNPAPSLVVPDEDSAGIGPFDATGGLTVSMDAGFIASAAANQRESAAMTVLSSGTTASGGGFEFDNIDPENIQAQAETWDGGVQAGSGRRAPFSSPGFHHFILRIDTAGHITATVDGVPLASGQGPIPFPRVTIALFVQSFALSFPQGPLPSHIRFDNLLVTRP